MESEIRHKCTYLQNRNRLTDIETDLWLPRGRGGEVGEGWTGSLGLADAN